MTQTTGTPFEKFALAAAFILPVLLFVSTIALVYGNIIGAEMLCIGISIVLPLFYILAAVKIESDHIKALTKAEAELSDIAVSDMKTLPPNWKASNTFFIAENVVLANDYFKSLFWFFRKIVGGESRGFSKLIVRARREAAVRVLRRAKEYGANAVWNIRFETSTISSNFGSNGVKSLAGVEILAYATAFTINSSDE